MSQFVIRHSSFVILLALASLLALTPSAHAELNVVATLPDYGAIAQAVGGDKVKVTSLVKGTEDPHFVDARPSFIRVLNQADVLLESGAELEVGWLPPLVNSARNAKILGDAPGHVTLAKGLRMLGVPTGPIDRSMGDVHPMGNPHFHLDLTNGRTMAATIARAFANLDPANKIAYEANLKQFNDRVDAKLVELTRILQPFRGTKVITYHKSFDYLLDSFGLVLAGTIEPKPGIEPSPTHINALIPRAKSEGVKLVLIEPNRPRKTPTFVAESIGARLIILPLSVGGAEKVTDYVELIDYDAARIAEALKQSK